LQIGAGKRFTIFCSLLLGLDDFVWNEVTSLQQEMLIYSFRDNLIIIYEESQAVLKRLKTTLPIYLRRRGHLNNWNSLAMFQNESIQFI